MAKKNVRIYLRITSELLEELKAEAEEQEMPVSTLCRQKLSNSSKLNRMEFLLQEINKKIK